MEHRVLEAVRNRFESTPPGYFERLLRQHRRPSWLTSDSPLSNYFDDQTRLLKAGRVVWACVVKANAGLYTVGAQAAPGVAVWSLDSWFDQRVRALKHVADHIEALRRWCVTDDPELADCIQHARDDFNCQSCCDVPRRLTGARLVRCGPIWIAPADFPTRVLACRWFPVLCSKDADCVKIVHSKYWPAEMIDAWGEATQRRAAADWEPYALPEQLSTWLTPRPDSPASEGSLDSAIEALEWLDFPYGAQCALLQAMRSIEPTEAHQLLLEIVGRSATAVGLFNGLPDGLARRLGRALAFARRGRLDVAKLHLREVRNQDPRLVDAWTRWLSDLNMA